MSEYTTTSNFKAEISQLESEGRGGTSQAGGGGAGGGGESSARWSPYLVIETFALCNNLKVVEELVRTHKFIVIIPLVGECVLAELND